MIERLVITEDGSHTLKISGKDEHFHSTHGAVQESMHVFINAGLRALSSKQKHIDILEIGMGTGLNAYLTLREVTDTDITINYTSIEAYPLDKEIYSQLNHAKIAPMPNGENMFLQIHDEDWGKEICFNNNFSLTKIHAKIDELVLDKVKFDLIYFDAFAPDIQPELWTADIFDKMYNALKSEGILTTYCAKGIVKRTLKASGFRIEELAGPPGKREMTRGVKSEQ